MIVPVTLVSDARAAVAAPEPARPRPKRPAPRRRRRLPPRSRDARADAADAFACARRHPHRPAATPPTLCQAAAAQEASLDSTSCRPELARATPRKAAPLYSPRVRRRGRKPRRRTAAGRRGRGLGAIQGVASRLNRTWNPNCGVEGGDQIQIRVRLSLTPEGTVTAMKLLDGVSSSGSDLTSVAADRALRAVRAAEPFSELPPDSYDHWRTFTVRFNAETACRGR